MAGGGHGRPHGQGHAIAKTGLCDHGVAMQLLHVSAARLRWVACARLRSVRAAMHACGEPLWC